jgi:hypothetical protein
MKSAALCDLDEDLAGIDGRAVFIDRLLEALAGKN